MISLNNPFREAIAATAWRGTCPDVPEVHAGVFEVCLLGLEHVRSSQTSKGLLIHGEAGSGKTHLLGRLRSKLTTTLPISTDRSASLFVWVRLQTSPRAIWRHLRRQLVEDLLRVEPGCKSQFERILFCRLAEVRPAEGDLERWIEYMREQNPTGLEDALDEIADRINLDFNTTVAFKHLAFERYRRDLKAWLCGDSLPESALARLGLAAEEGSEEDREHAARQVVLMLCQLAGCNLPIAMCFDQVEALQISASDYEGLYAFGQLVSTLHDSTSNLLIVSCVQSAYSDALKTRSRGADYDRMISWSARQLEPLTLSQAEKVIAARISAVGASGLWPKSPGWPLGIDALQRLAAASNLTPRRLLTLCAEAFDIWASGGDPTPEISSAAPESLVATNTRMTEEFLASDWERRQDDAAASNRPQQTNDIVRDGLPLLLRIVAPELSLARDDALQDVELIFAGADGRKIGVSLCTQSNMNSLAARLKRLKQQWSSGRLRKLVILRDGRVPISKTAGKTLQSLDELGRAGATVWHAPAEALIALDTLSGLLADAKSGDLANHGQIILPESVEDWLRAQLPACFDELIETVTVTEGHSAAEDIVGVESIATLLAAVPVMSLDELSQSLHRPAATVRATVETHPEQFRLLKGPPVVVFRVS